MCNISILAINIHLFSDAQLPSFTNIPRNQVVTADPGLATAVVTWIAPSVTYTLEPAPTVISSHESGDAFPIGHTEVTFTAIDSFGESVRDDFTVVVLGM